jgi:hypothetical protein
MTITPDLINGLIELTGAVFTWRNAWQLWKDREVRGVYWPTSLFFTVWGAWNLYYYPSLNQWFSFYAGILLATGNLAWLTMAVRFKQMLSMQVQEE